VWTPAGLIAFQFTRKEIAMPLSASALNKLSRRFSKKGLFDVSDSFAIAATCTRRGDIVGREVWIDTALEKLSGHNIPVPTSIFTTYLHDLAA
jgi:hypothetical protein